MEHHYIILILKWKTLNLINVEFCVDFSIQHAMGIYIISNIKNGKIYIGSTKDFRSRYDTHNVLLFNNKHYNKRLQNSYNKNGCDFFEFKLLEIVEDKSQLLIREQHWIDKLYPWYNLLRIAGEVRHKIVKKVPKDVLAKTHCLTCKTAKLSESDVLNIINLLNSGESAKEISKKYNVVARSITDIKYGTSYKHLTHLVDRNSVGSSYSKLLDEHIIEMVQLINNGLSNQQLADKFNVSWKCIEYIRKKRRWFKYSQFVNDKYLKDPTTKKNRWH